MTGYLQNGEGGSPRKVATLPALQEAGASMLRVVPGKKARFVCNFVVGQPDIESAIRAYIGAVKGKEFPAPEHCF